MELRKLNRIAAASAVFFAFVALGVRSTVNVLAKDDLAFDASELKDKKTSYDRFIIKSQFLFC